MLERPLDLRHEGLHDRLGRRLVAAVQVDRPMTASITDASTRSVSTSVEALCPTPSGAWARSRSGTPSRSATARHDGPETACARIFVSRPAPKRSASRRGYRKVVTARPRTESPRNARREYESDLRSVHDACVNTCRWRSSGSSERR
jgi:hypothetical protein